MNANCKSCVNLHVFALWVRRRLNLLPILFLLLWPVDVFGEVPLRSESALTPLGKSYTLPNGFTLALYPTRNGVQERTEVRLVMRVGSAHESDADEGVAHFIEHMAFAPEWIMRTLTGYGNRYGSDFNAYTGYDRTVYSFSIPSGDDSAMLQALRVVRHWMFEMQFQRQHVERERGVIAREIADFASADPLSKAKLAGNPLYSRFPIGRHERVQRIDEQRLAHFYRRHYSPSAATLIVAGPIDTAACYQLARAMLADIPAPREFVEQPNFDVFLTHVPSFSATPAAEDSLCRVSLYWPYRYGVQTSCGDWLRNVCIQTCASVINSQLHLHGSRMSFSVDWYLNREGFISLEGSYHAAARLDTAVLRALSVVYGIARHCNDSKLFLLLRDKALSIAEQVSLPTLAVEAADRMVDEALVEVEGGASELEVAWLRDTISRMDSTAWRRMLRAVVPQGMPLVADVEGGSLENHQLAISIAKAERMASDSSVSTVLFHREEQREERKINIPNRYLNPLLPDSEPSRIKHFPTLNATLYRVNSGIPILVKRMDTDDSTVYVVATWRGGLLDTSLYPRAVQEALGSAFELSRAGQLPLSAQDSIFYQEGISQLFISGPAAHRVMMVCPSRRLDLAVRMLRDRLVDVSWDTVAFDSLRMESIRGARRDVAAKRALLPAQRINAFTTRLVDPKFSVDDPSADVWQQVDIQKLSSYYESLFTIGEGLQIIAIGPMGEDTIAAAFARNFDLRYKETENSGKSIKWKPKRPFESPKEGLVTFISFWRGDVFEGGLRGSLLLKLMRDALQDEALRTLRMEQQIVYSPFVSIRYDMMGSKTFALIVDGDCDASQLSKARGASEAALQALAKKGISYERLNGYRQAFLASKGRELTPYAVTAWRDWLVNSVEEGATFDELDSYEAVLTSITPQMLRSCFRKFSRRAKHGFFAISLEE